MTKELIMIVQNFTVNLLKITKYREKVSEIKISFAFKTIYFMNKFKSALIKILIFVKSFSVAGTIFSTL